MEEFFCCNNCGNTVIETRRLDGYLKPKNFLMFQKDDFGWEFFKTIYGEEKFVCSECDVNFDAIVEENFIYFDSKFVFKQLKDVKKEPKIICEDWPDAENKVRTKRKYRKRKSKILIQSPEFCATLYSEPQRNIN